MNRLQNWGMLCLFFLLLAAWSVSAQGLGDTPALFCPECGASNEAGSRFCAHCGSLLPSLAVPVQPVQVKNDSVTAPAARVWSKNETEESTESFADALKSFQNGAYDDAVKKFGRVKRVYPRSRYMPYCDYLTGVCRDMQKLDEKDPNLAIFELNERGKKGNFGGGFLAGFVSFPLLILLIAALASH